jgi:ABC-type cobalamin/Fe3+-siderophores transport system ATPase subunit
VTGLLHVHDLSYEYPGNRVLQSVRFSASSGEFIVLMGLNGAGKSTLLDIIGGLRRPLSGEVFLNNRKLLSYPAKERAHKISHLPQGTRQDLPFTVEQVVLMGRYAYADRWFESDEDHSYAQDAMRRMDCLWFRDRLFSTLSGGERQRVLLASCIAQCPELMLLDEPSTYLDVQQQLHCFSTLAELAREGALSIAVTHDLNLALAHCSRIMILDQGKLAADFKVEEAATDDARWLSLLAPNLHLARTPQGRPWVVYQ